MRKTITVVTIILALITMSGCAREPLVQDSSEYVNTGQLSEKETNNINNDSIQTNTSSLNPDEVSDKIFEFVEGSETKEELFGKVKGYFVGKENEFKSLNIATGSFLITSDYNNNSKILLYDGNKEPREFYNTVDYYWTCNYIHKNKSLFITYKIGSETETIIIEGIK